MQTEYTRRFIEDVIKDMEQKEILVAACDVFDLLSTKENITEDEIEPIVIAAIHKSMGVWQIGANVFDKLDLSHFFMI
jgi:hypothetical protein